EVTEGEVTEGDAIGPGACEEGDGGTSGEGTGFVGRVEGLSALRGLLSSSAIFEILRAKRSPPENEAPSQAMAIATARAGATSRAPRQSTLPSSSRARRAESGSWQREARMPRILFEAMEAPTPLPQMSTPTSTKPRSTACPTARA